MTLKTKGYSTASLEKKGHKYEEKKLMEIGKSQMKRSRKGRENVISHREGRERQIE